jgi:hypothetical protein
VTAVHMRREGVWRKVGRPGLSMDMGGGEGATAVVAVVAVLVAPGGEDPTLAGQGSDDVGQEMGQEGSSSGGGNNQAAQPIDGGVGKVGGGGEEDDVLVQEDFENELDNSLRPDHRFFAVRALVEGGINCQEMEQKDEATLEQRRRLSP